MDMMVAGNMSYDSQELLDQEIGKIIKIEPGKITYKKGDGKLYTSDPADLIIVGGVS